VLDQLTDLRRRAAEMIGLRFDQSPITEEQPLDLMLARQAEIGSLRGVTSAAADVSECACPESCERDHANE
jgi:hypothetical protein